MVDEGDHAWNNSVRATLDTFMKSLGAFRCHYSSRADVPYHIDSRCQMEESNG
jgi:hypothetical protein